MGLFKGLIVAALAGGPKNIANKIEENERRKQERIAICERCTLKDKLYSCDDVMDCELIRYNNAHGIY